MNQKKQLIYKQGSGFFLLILVMLCTMVSCDKCDFKETKTGLLYKVIKKGEGPKPTKGQVLLLEICYETQDGKLLFSSADEGQPIVMDYDPAQYYPGGELLLEVFNMLEKGDEYVFKIPAKALLGDQFDQMASENKLTEKTLLLLRIGLKDIVTHQQLKEMELEHHKNKLKQYQERTIKQLPKDLEMINNYLKSNKIQASSTKSGLHYVIEKSGSGAHPKAGDIVKINYVGKTLAGKIFDTNLLEVARSQNLFNAARTYEPMSVKLGEGNLIIGFEEGIMYLKKHAKAQLFIPSVLAYGEAGIPPIINPDENLIFDVEIVDILVSNKQ